MLLFSQKLTKDESQSELMELMREYEEEKEEVQRLRRRIYELEDQLWSHWFSSRLNWLKRQPLLRFLWFIAIFIGWILSTIKFIFRRPTFSAKYDPELVENEAKKLANLKSSEFEDKFHRIALKSVIVNSLLKSEMKDFVSVVPFPRYLEKKLRIEKYLKSMQITSSRPPAIFIVGLPRTGSTILHQLCAADDRSRSIRAWEFRMPFECSDCPKSSIERIQKTQNILDSFYKLAPAIRSVHYVRALDPDECVQGFYDCAMPDWYLWGAIDASEAYNWYVNGDMTDQYRNYEKFLRVVLNNQESSSSSSVTNLWLKTPHHTYKLLELAKVFPEAKFVWLHRDPVPSVGSCCSMNQAILDATCPWYVDSRVLGDRTLKRLSACVKKGLIDRIELEKQGRIFVDVQYSDMKKDIHSTMKKMYEELGLNSTFSKEYLEKMRQLLKPSADSTSSPRHHQYNLEDFGLNEKRVKKEFKEYIAQYL